MRGDAQSEDRYLPPGTRVRHDGVVLCGGDESSDEEVSECGVVVHCWMSDEIDCHDCYVAFFGNQFPGGEPSERPYILRYAAIGFVILPAPGKQDIATDSQDRYLPAGTRVRLALGSDRGPEYGIIVHCWMNEEVRSYDCYVAFFGANFPDGKPSEPPYLLRYLSTSLVVIE
jgi:hypothetical protein